MTLSLKQRAFLNAYRHHGHIWRARVEAGCGYWDPYRWLRDEEFRKAMRAAWREATDRLEQEALHRAKAGITCFQGWKRPGEG